jgi:hypothetical protein
MSNMYNIWPREEVPVPIIILVENPERKKYLSIYRIGVDRIILK